MTDLPTLEKTLMEEKYNIDALLARKEKDLLYIMFDWNGSGMQNPLLSPVGFTYDESTWKSEASKTKNGNISLRVGEVETSFFMEDLIPNSLFKALADLYSEENNISNFLYQAKKLLVCSKTGRPLRVPVMVDKKGNNFNDADLPSDQFPTKYPCRNHRIEELLILFKKITPLVEQKLQIKTELKMKKRFKDFSLKNIRDSVEVTIRERNSENNLAGIEYLVTRFKGLNLKNVALFADAHYKKNPGRHKVMKSLIDIALEQEKETETEILMQLKYEIDLEIIIDKKLSKFSLEDVQKALFILIQQNNQNFVEYVINAYEKKFPHLLGVNAELGMTPLQLAKYQGNQGIYHLILVKKSEILKSFIESEDMENIIKNMSYDQKLTQNLSIDMILAEVKNSEKIELFNQFFEHYPELKLKALFHAISTDNLDAVKLLINSDPQLIKKVDTERKATPLLLAIAYKRHSIVNFFRNIAYKNPDMEDTQGIKFFKERYLDEYEKARIKNPWSTMKQMLETNQNKQDLEKNSGLNIFKNAYLKSYGFFRGSWNTLQPMLKSEIKKPINLFDIYDHSGDIKEDKRTDKVLGEMKETMMKYEIKTTVKR